MITYVVCDLFESPARVLVNTVNTVGVMGKGIAKKFKAVYPEMFAQYQGICEKGSLDVGNLWLYKTSNKWILNFPTKRHWRQPSRPEYIRAGLRKFVEVYHIYGITSISFPLLGCGNGELDWESEVKPLMEDYLGRLPITAFIHRQDLLDPFEPEHRNIRSMREWLREEPQSLGFSEVWDDLCALPSTDSLFQNPDTGEEFYVTASEEADRLRISTEEAVYDIPSEALLELWQQIRQLGFLSGESLPYGLDVCSDYILPVMARLPYVELVRMSGLYSKEPPQRLGLRLSLRNQPKQLALFAGISSVVPE